MRRTGKISASALSIVTQNEVELVRRPRPPADLTDEQSDEWVKIVDRLPADWFPPETHGMLAQLCRHVVASRKIGQLVAACEGRRHLDLDRYEKLLRMQERESRIIASLSTKMRISQATSQHGLDKKPSLTPAPWGNEEAEEDEGREEH